LPTRYCAGGKEEYLADGRSHHAQEAELRAAGFYPAVVGHRMVGPGSGRAYQDALVRYLQARGIAVRGGVTLVGENLTASWRDMGQERLGLLKMG